MGDQKLNVETVIAPWPGSPGRDLWRWPYSYSMARIAPLERTYSYSMARSARGALAPLARHPWEGPFDVAILL